MADQPDHELAAELAESAGVLLLEVRQELANAEAATLKDEGDRRSHELLASLLAQHRPDDAVLSEEGKDDLERLSAERVWIIDPLDGTREFGEPPRSDWAVHVALVEDSAPTAGAVALPGLPLTLSTAAPPTPPATDAAPVRIICSRTRPGPAAEGLAAAMEGELIYMGSAGAKAMAVVQGDADIYAHTGGQYEWDSCAPVAVAVAAGLHASRLDGTPLLYNQRDPYLPDLLICRSDLAQAALETLAGL
ncbi:MAG: 3'(2'),5'-bisphosphate nucleotidase CysQ [Acidimicrobiales bacterium]